MNFGEIFFRKSSNKSIDKIKKIITKAKYSSGIKKKKIKNNKFLTPLAAAVRLFYRKV